MKTKTIINLLKNGMYLIMAVLMMGTVTSCSDDEGFDTPKYASEAAKYKIASASSDIASVELTESGNYIISPHKTMAAVAQAKNGGAAVLNNGIWRAPMQLAPSARYGSMAMWLCGEYHKSGEGTYILEGYGNLTIKWDAENNSYSLVLTPANGEPMEYIAHKEQHKNDGSMSDKLCRTWEVESYGYSLKRNGKVLLNVRANNFYDLADKVLDIVKKEGIGDIDIEEWTDIEADDIPVKVIFSKSGTYAVFYLNKEVDVAMWRWKNEKAGVLLYDWEADDWDDSYDDDNCAKVDFKDNKLRVVDGYIDDEDEEYYEELFTTVLHEVK